MPVGNWNCRQLETDAGTTRIGIIKMMALWMLHESKKCMGFCIDGALFDHGVCTRIPNCRDTDGEMQMRCKCGSEVSSKDNGSDELLDSLRFGFNLKLIYWFDLPTHSLCLRCMAGHSSRWSVFDCVCKYLNPTQRLKLQY